MLDNFIDAIYWMGRAALYMYLDYLRGCVISRRSSGDQQDLLSAFRIVSGTHAQALRNGNEQQVRNRGSFFGLTFPAS
jgi:hypothetical protein